MPKHPPAKVDASDLRGSLDTDPNTPFLLSREEQAALARWIAAQDPSRLPNTHLTPDDLDNPDLINFLKSKGLIHVEDVLEILHVLREFSLKIVFDHTGQYYVMYPGHSDQLQFMMLREEQKANFLRKRGVATFEALSGTPRGLGKGAFGEVTLCQRQDGTWMASKLLEFKDYEEPLSKNVTASDDGGIPELIKQTHNEYHIGSQLHGDDISLAKEIRTFTIETADWLDEDSAYSEKTLHMTLFMPLLEGITLKTFLSEAKANPVSEEMALEIVLKILIALADFKEKRILHRDLKLENIMLLPNGNIEIFDFGLAVQLKEGQTTLSAGSAGTAEYQAPELFSSEKNSDALYSEKSELFAVGRIAMQLLYPEAGLVRDDPHTILSTPPVFNTGLEAKPPAPITTGRSILNYRNERLQEMMSLQVPAWDKARKGAPVKETTVDFFLSLLSPNPSDRPSLDQALRIASSSRPDSGLGSVTPPNAPPQKRV